LSVPKNSSKQPQKPSFSPQSGLGFAYRVGIEFISGILVGLILGYAFDYMLGTQPWGLVIMVLLGASAGLMNIFRLLGLWPSPFSKPPTNEEEDG
jgi:ATP synthase protein I